jgi:hypothetical protein
MGQAQSGQRHCARHRPHLLRVPLPVISGAAANISRQATTDLFLCRIWIALCDLFGGYDHAGRAEPALDAVLIPDDLLHRMELRVRGQALNRSAACTVSLPGKHCAAFDGLSVQLDGTGAAK